MADETVQRPSRRNFLALAWRFFTLLAAGQGAYLGLRFLASRRTAVDIENVVTIGLASDFAPGTITPLEGAHLYLIRFGDGSFLALNSKCTHLACIVGWQNDVREFTCPCHGSRFKRDGNVSNPPAPRPLDRFEITFTQDGRLQVNIGRPIVRTAVSESDLVFLPQLPDSNPKD